jgi:hypothetical protein
MSKQAENLQWQLIKTERDRRRSQGGYRVDTKWFHSDPDSRTQQIGLARKADKVDLRGGNMNSPMMRIDDPTKPLVWKTMDGSWVLMTPTLAIRIFEAAEAADSSIYAYAEYLNYLITHAPNPMTVNLYQGWPQSYFDTLKAPSP